VSAPAAVRTGVAPRAVFCPIAHLHRDRAVADAAVAGRFTECGRTLALGVEPDWLGADLPADEEWRLAWTKFYVGLDLAHAFAETGDARYVDAWTRLVRSWIAQVPNDRDSADVTARRITNWIYAWAAFAGAGAELAPATQRALLASVRGQAAHVRRNLTAERNHRTLELYALYLTGLALPEADPGGRLLAFATAELARNLEQEFRPDGTHRESSTHYHAVALRSFVAARDNARRAGIDFPTRFDERLTRACEFLLHVHRPDGAIPALSDSDTAGYGALLDLAGRLLGRDDFRYAASRGAAGRPPRERNVSFPDGGYHVQRSGWGEASTPLREERFLVFDCGPLGDGGHGHYDLLAIEAAAGGRPLLVDPGRYTYSEDGENLRRWFKGTAAHNTVCVDGRDQTPYRRGKPKGAVATGRLVERLRAPGLDVLVGEAESPCYEALHRRRVVFVADRYWVVEDVLAGAGRHRYDLRWHLPADAGDVRIEPGAHGTVIHARGVDLAVWPAADARIEPGWVAPTYGVREPAPVVSVVQDDVAHARFVTVIAPRAHAGEEPPRLSVEVDGGVVTVVVEGGEPSATDHFVWRDAPAAVPIRGARPDDAALCWLRDDGAGAALAASAAWTGGRSRGWDGEGGR
jgi:hypothetical protein